MKKLTSIATNHPVVFAISATILWFVLELALTGVASGVLRKPYGDPGSATVGRLVTTACVLLLLGRMGWLGPAGVTRLGRWQVWLAALGGLIYYSAASLYSFYGKVEFNFASLVQSSTARDIIMTQFAVGLSEEVMFRGLVLYGLVRIWGSTKKGLIVSVVLASLIFAAMHLTGIFSYGVSPSSALLLTVQTCVIAIWWGALVLRGGSIWPAVLVHFVGNAVVAVQGVTSPILEPVSMAYGKLLLFSIVLGVIGIGWLVRGQGENVGHV